MISLLAFAIPLALDLAWPSTLWNFDGVACAAALELGWPLYFFHANHLLYGFLGFLFWKAGALVGLARALPALQLFTSLLASAGLVGLYRTLKPLLQDEVSALLLTVGLGATAAFWVWSVEAQVYALGFLPLAWATCVLLGPETRQKYALVGLLHAGAVLGHLLHAIWIVPAFYWIGRKPKALRDYLAALTLATLLPYALVLAFVVVPGRDTAHILIWLKGSAGLTPDRSWAWHSAGWSGPWQWLESTVPALWGSFWPYKNLPVGAGLWMLTSVSMGIVLIKLLASGSPRKNPLAAFSWIWLLAYGAFLSTWEPATLCYRMTDVIPLGILLALGMKRWKAPLLFCALFVATTLPVNFFTRIHPMHQSFRNKAYQDALTLSKISSPNSLYITEGGPPWIYLLYFTGRTALNARTLSPEALNEAIARRKGVAPVYRLEGETWKKVS